jgi:hypothetical protein
MPGRDAYLDGLLDEISKVLGLSGKPEDVDGSRVEGMVLAGQIEEVARATARAMC